MRRRRPAGRTRLERGRPPPLLSFAPVLLLVLGVAATASACTAAVDNGPAARPTDAMPVIATPSLPDDDEVTLTLYFRTGSGQEALLAPVQRTIPVAENLPLAALEELLAGPAEEEGRTLNRPFPAGTEVVDFSTTDQTAQVTLSSDVVTDAGAVVNAPRHELIALAALANTMTEFPSIERVELTVEGQENGREFWGGWGLPETLVRDETLIAPLKDGEGIPELSRFRNEAQSSGGSDAPPVRVENVRVRDRIAYVRVVVELADAEETDLPATAFPSIRAWPTPDGLVLDVSGVATVAELEIPDSLSDPTFGTLEIDDGPDGGRFQIRLPLDDERAFYLHTVSGPSRILLDVKK